MRPAVLIALACLMQAQTPSDLTFEVASVKRAAPIQLPDGRIAAPIINGGPGTKDPQRITYRYDPLISLIMTAWNLRFDQITAPGWLTTEHYDITANVPPGAMPAQVNIMLQNLVRERFHLRFHTETKDRPVYFLRAGNTGPKLAVHVAADAPDPARPIGRPDDQGYPGLPPSYKGVLARRFNGELMIRGQSATVAQLIQWLEGPLGRPVIDETALTGLYDFRIHFDERGRDAGFDPAPTVLDAIESQLGLRLESGKRPFDNFIVDSIDREPTPN